MMSQAALMKHALWLLRHQCVCVAGKRPTHLLVFLWGVRQFVI